LVFLSSVRAQSGPAAAHVLREVDPPEPTENYGRAKLAAERAVSACGAPYTILRPVMVYGAGASGNFASLMRLAYSSWPLPFGSFKNLRSLASLENLIRAIVFALNSAKAINETYLVADPMPVMLAEIVAALRMGAGRPANLFAMPPTWFAAAFQLAGRTDIWERLGGSLVVDPGKLLAAGWRPQFDTKEALARLQSAAVGEA
jgi:nucleoside-diphosphate-sugar epimerase